MSESFNYEKHAYCYQEIVQSDQSHGAYIHINRIQELIKLLPHQARLLDYGCGAGAILRAIQKIRPDLELYGADISKIALKEAENASKNIKYTLINDRRLPFEDSFFDCIIMLEVLEHVPSPDITLIEIDRLLAKTGTFFLAVPQEKSKKTFQGLIYPFFKKQLSFLTAGHLHFWTEKELISLLSKHHFKITHRTYSQHYIWQIIGIVYMLYLVIIHKQTQELSKNLEARQSYINNLLIRVMHFLVYLTNLESIVLKKISTGLDIQFTLTKTNDL